MKAGFLICRWTGFLLEHKVFPVCKFGRFPNMGICGCVVFYNSARFCTIMVDFPLNLYSTDYCLAYRNTLFLYINLAFPTLPSSSFLSRFTFVFLRRQLFENIDRVFLFSVVLPSIFSLLSLTRRTCRT